MSETARNTDAPAAAPEQALVPAPARPAGRLVTARTPPRAAQTSIDLRGLLRAFCRRWILALTLGLLLAAAGFAGVYYYLPPPVATASSLLHVQAIPSKLAFDLGERPADFQNTQVTLAKSRLVLNVALSNPKAASLRILQAEEDPMEWLEQSLKIAFVGSPEIMQISLASTLHTEDLVPLVDVITQAYLDQVVHREVSQHRANLAQLRDIARVCEDKIKGTRSSLRVLQEQVGSGGDKNLLALRQETARLEYEQAREELTRLRSELRALRLQVEAQEKGTPSEAVISAVQIEARLEKDPLIQQYEQQKRQIDEAMEDIRQRAVLGEKEPSLAIQRNRLAQVREAAQKRRKQLESYVTEQLKETANVDARFKQVALRQRLAYLTKLEALVAKDAERLRKESQEVVKNTLDLIDLQRGLDEKEELLRTINKRAAALEVELEAPSRVRPIQQAVLRRPKDQIRRLAFSGGAALALLLLSAAGVSLVEYRTRRLDSTASVSDELGMTVIGTVPVYRPGKTLERQVPAYWERRLVDSVDAARTLLLHIARREDLKVVMIASAEPAEGKTSLSGQLAASLARAGRRTLLIDADLRKPALHEVLGLAAAPGLSEVLRCEGPLSAVIQTTPIPNLFFLAAGQSDDVVFQILAGDGMAGVLASLRPDYDFILVDSSPILPVPDGLMMAQQMDGVLFSVMQRVSRVPSVKAACQRLSMVGTRILGAVVSGSRDDAGYGYRYHYYYPAPPSDRRST